MHDGKGVVQDRFRPGISAKSSSNARTEAYGHANGGEPHENNCLNSVLPGMDPFDTVEWDKRTAHIKDESGDVLFEQTDCEIPETWSHLATNVVVSKYFYGEPGTPERETSVRQLIHRVTRTIADWGIADGYFATREDGENFYRDLTWLCLHQYGSFNSPVWFNVGLYHQYGIKGSQWQLALGCRRPARSTSPRTPYEYPQARPASSSGRRQHGRHHAPRPQRGHALQVRLGHGHRPVDAPLAPRKALRRRHAVGAAVVHAGLRPDCRRREERRQDPPRGQDAVAEGLASRHHGVHRGQGQGREEGPHADRERRLRRQLQRRSLQLDHVPEREPLGPRLGRVHAGRRRRPASGRTHWVTDPKVAGPEHEAKYLLRQIAEGTWYCGDPGVQYETTINRWHTCPNSGRINASNPCSEYMFLDDTACNLASINLKKFQEAGRPLRRRAVPPAAAIFIIAQEILVDHASYPTPAIAENSHVSGRWGWATRTWAACSCRWPSPTTATKAAALPVRSPPCCTGQAYSTSSRIAADLGPFDGYDENERPMLRVMEMHRDAVDEIDEACPRLSQRAARQVWDECSRAAAGTAIAMPRPRCWLPPARSPS